MTKETFLKQIKELGFEVLIDNAYRIHFKNENYDCNYLETNNTYIVNDEIYGK